MGKNEQKYLNIGNIGNNGNNNDNRHLFIDFSRKKDKSSMKFINVLEKCR